MIELAVGAMVVAAWICVAPRVVADAVATWRASKAGQWDVIEKDRDRRDKRAASRRESLSKAWHNVRAARNRRAGGDGNYRPGASAYLGDLYHDFWEDRLEKRKVKRSARPPYEYNPDAPKWHERFDAAVLDKVQRLRDVSGRAGRMLIDPVGEGRTQRVPVSAPVVTDDEDRPAPWPPVIPGMEPCERGGCNGHITFDQVWPGRCVHQRQERDYHCDTCGWLSSHVPMTACEQCEKPPARADVTPTRDVPIPKAPLGPEMSAERVNAILDEMAPKCPDCGRQMVAAPYAGPSVPENSSLKTPPYRCPNCGTQIAQEIAVKPDGTAWVMNRRRVVDNTAGGTNTEGDTTMTDTAVDVLKYNQAVADHEQALAGLRAQLDQASALASHLSAAVGAVEGMDSARDKVATATTVLAEGLEQGRYGATSLEGAATSAEILTAGQVSATEEAIEAAQTQNQEWIAGLEVAIAGVEASLTEIQAQFGEAAAVVQETGVDGRALEAE